MNAALPKAKERDSLNIKFMPVHPTATFTVGIVRPRVLGHLFCFHLKNCFHCDVFFTIFGKE
jgi:hypothetical protein